ASGNVRVRERENMCSMLQAEQAVMANTISGMHYYMRMAAPVNREMQVQEEIRQTMNNHQFIIPTQTRLYFHQTVGREWAVMIYLWRMEKKNNGAQQRIWGIL